MRNVRRRLHVLERLPQLQLPPRRLEQIRNLAIPSWSERDLKLLWAISLEPVAEMRPREISEGQAASCVAWGTALKTEDRRIGFRSLAEAVRTAGQRR